MGILGFIISLVAVLFLIIGLVPFLGWSNWFTTMPAATLTIILCGVSMGRNRPPGRLAIAGLVIGIAVFIIGLLRLTLGGGIL